MHLKSQEKRPLTFHKISRGDLTLTARKSPSGLVQIELSNIYTRMQRFKVTCYQVGDLMIDTGFTKIETLLEQFLAPCSVSAVACTHNHEDHAGNCQLISSRHGCPVFLAHPERQWDEGVGHLPLYRRLWFGPPPPYMAEEMPEVIEGEKHRMRVIPIPGHSVTHSALFWESEGVLFCGDLFISGGVTAVMRHENPYESVSSLRLAASLSPRHLVNGHGLILENPANALLEKAQKIEDAAGQIMHLHQQGLGERAIARRIFQGGWIKDRLMKTITWGEFCRQNFMRAAIRFGKSFPEPVPRAPERADGKTIDETGPLR